MFADTDFVLALIKDSDWLKENAKKIYLENSQNIWTSASVMFELLIISKRLNLNAQTIVLSTNKLIQIRGIEFETILRTAYFIDELKVGVFDSIHAASSYGDVIISSDEVYDKIGLERMKLK